MKTIGSAKGLNIYFGGNKKIPEKNRLSVFLN